MKIWREYSKRQKRYLWKARFEFNNKQFRIAEETQDDLDKLIAEIKEQERAEKLNKKFNLDRPTVEYVPTVREVFDIALTKIKRPHQQKIAERVFDEFLSLFEYDLKVTDLDTSHFDDYQEHRTGQLGKQSKQPVKLQTARKELYAVTSALKKASQNRDFPALKSWALPKMPELPKQFKRKTKRTRLVTQKELNAVLDELRKPPTGKMTHAAHFARVRLADTIEFQFETGLRRKEICALKFNQFDEAENVLRNVRRFKTDEITPVLPVSQRATEIIEARRIAQKDCLFIFTPDGTPIESAYRTLRNVCASLQIEYGRFNDGGFVLHDLRRNFATEILAHTDIETTRAFLAHSNISQTQTYVRTDTNRMKQAIKKREKKELGKELDQIFEDVRKGKLNKKEFADTIKKIFA